MKPHCSAAQIRAESSSKRWSQVIRFGLRFSREGKIVRRSIWVGLVVLCLVCGLYTSVTLAQAVFGSILGTVTDAQGNAVSGAKVTVTSLSKNTAFETTSNESGNYSVTHLIPDNYPVNIEATGFKAYDVASVAVSADTSVNVDAALQVGAVTQTVEVTGEIPQLQTDRADVDVQFSQKYVEDLPILNRNFTNFELLSPGTQKLPGFSHAATENPQGGGQIQVNGQHFSGTNFELDGTDNQDPILGIIVVNPNLDAIAETKIALQDYDAESGKATSGVIRVQTKSGSNSFHGIIVVNPNLDAIAETKIALQDYDAESGKATSGVIRVQTKSGSNSFHGS